MDIKRFSKNKKTKIQMNVSLDLDTIEAIKEKFSLINEKPNFSKIINENLEIFLNDLDTSEFSKYLEDFEKQNETKLTKNEHIPNK